MMLKGDAKTTALLYTRGTGKHRGQMRSQELDMVAHLCNDFQKAGAFCDNYSDAAFWLLVLSSTGKHRKGM